MISWNHHVNASAIGADINIDEGELNFKVYCPSDTERNLESNPNFTYSLTDSPELFFKAALTGNNRPGCELNQDELVVKGGFYYPRDASRIFFCQVKDSESGNVIDEYASSEYYGHKAVILDRQGEGAYIGRANPYVDAMVYASRYNVVESGEQKNKIRQRVKNILKDEKRALADKILMYVDGGRS